jgi:hypothetical protein
LSESPADEAAIRILVEGLCGKQTEPVAAAPLRARGVDSVLPVLEPVIVATKAIGEHWIEYY